METFDLFSVISIAFLGSFGHCIGMCGGIVIAYSSASAEKPVSNLKQSIYHLLYSMGRVTTYSLLGAVFGGLGAVIAFSTTTKGVLFALAGMAMVMAGLALMGKIRFFGSAEISMAGSSWYQQKFRALIHGENWVSYYSLGLLNGLLPCGFVYFFALTAASTASPFYGAIVMFIFGVSTIPALFGLGFFVSIMKQVKIRRIFNKIAAFTVIAYGLFTLYKGVMFVADPGSMSMHNMQKMRHSEGTQMEHQAP